MSQNGINLPDGIEPTNLPDDLRSLRCLVAAAYYQGRRDQLDEDQMMFDRVCGRVFSTRTAVTA